MWRSSSNKKNCSGRVRFFKCNKFGHIASNCEQGEQNNREEKTKSGPLEAKIWTELRSSYNVKNIKECTSKK